MTTVILSSAPTPSIVTRHDIVHMQVPLPCGITVELLLGEGWAVWVCGEKRWRAEVWGGVATHEDRKRIVRETHATKAKKTDKWS